MALQFYIPTQVKQTITNGVTAYAPSEDAVYDALQLKANITDLVSLFVTARNNTGSTILKGTIVYVSGAVGQNPTIALAKADAEATSFDIGVAAFDIPNNTNVQNNVITNGLIDGIDTSSFSDGDLLYLSATVAGGIVNIAPSSPYFSQFIGYCLHSHVTQGKILIRTSTPIDANTTISTSNRISPSSAAIRTNLNLKQDTLVSGTNIKTINGTSILGSGNISISSGITIGTTTVTSGTTTRILYNNAGVVGEYTLTGTGTVVAMQTSPTFATDITTPKIIGGTGTTSKITYVGSTNATPTSTAIAHELMVGNNGAVTAVTVYHNGRSKFFGTVPSGGGVVTIQKSGTNTTFGKPYLTIGIDEYYGNMIQSIAFGYKGADTSNSPAEFGFIQSYTTGQGTGDFVWALRTSASAGSDAVPVEMMRLTYGGNLGIGVTAPTAFLSIAAGTTAKAQINFASSTAPTTPNNGDVWFDGTNLKIRVSGTTYTLTKV